MTVEGRKGIIIPERKPVTLVLQEHGDDNVHRIPVFKNIVHDRLIASDPGKLVVVLEVSNGSRAAMLRIRQLMADGVFPSQAIAAVRELNHKQSVPPFVAYNRARNQALDELYKAAPKRLEVVTEAYTPREYPKVNMGVEGTIFFRQGPKQTFEDALRVTDARQVRIEQKQKERDWKIIAQTMLELERPEVSEAVLLLGPYHTQDSMWGDQPVERIFTDEDDGQYIYDPITEYGRGIRRNPDQARSMVELGWIVDAEIELEQERGETSQQFYRRKHDWIREKMATG